MAAIPGASVVPTSYRQLAVELDTSALRRELFEGREHVVIPAIVLVGDVVITASGSNGPELVPAEELAKAPASWNGRPVLSDHPVNGLANEPRTLEAMSFGQLFNSKFEDNRLKTEIWADVEKVDTLGLDVITKAEAGEVMDDSAGVFMTLQEVSGIRNGKSFVGIWRDIVPEHLAVLPQGVKGACGLSDGCGANRLAKDGQMNLASFVSRIRQLQDVGTSDNDLHSRLTAALRAVTPGFDWVEDVFQESSTVIYSVFLESSFTFWRQSFTIDDGAVTLVGEPEQVEPTTAFQTLSLDSASDLCNNDNAISLSTTTTDHDTGDEQMANDTRKEELVQKLIECSCTQFKEGHRTALETLEVDALEMLQPTPDVPADVVDDEPEPKDAKPDDASAEPAGLSIPDGHVLLTVEDHARMKDSSDAFHAQQLVEKADIVANLSASQKTFDSAELDAMPVSSLRKMSALQQEMRPDVNYAGVEPASRQASVSTAPRSYDLALAKTAATEVN